jgi:hypothetical protein
MNTAEQTKPKKRTLSEIVEDFRRVLHGIDDLEGEVSPELEAQLNEVEATLTEKVDRCLWVAREAEAQAGVYTERAKALQDRARVLKRQSERLEDYVQWCLMTLNVPKLETPNFVVSIQNSPSSLGLIANSEEDLIKILINDCDKAHQPNPLSFWIYDPPTGLRIKVELDKKAILAELKSGKIRPVFNNRAWIIDDKKHLRVK